jgi:agmatine deiminase
MSNLFRMPAEWEKHRATWIAWPHLESDWPDKFETIPWVYVEIVRALARSEKVEILCESEDAISDIREKLALSGIAENSYNLHLVPTNRSWLRDSGPTFVKSETGEVLLTDWQFNAWAKYDNYNFDVKVPEAIEKITGLKRVQVSTDKKPWVVLEGGSIDVDGQGTMLTTKECLLSDVQCRNPGFVAKDYEKLFADYLGIKKTIWLERGFAGDDTHGHVDDICRFVAPGKVLLAFEEDKSDYNYQVSVENFEILQNSTDANGKKLEVIKLPVPRPIIFGEERLPASYANFYIANKTVLVPTFNDPADLQALKIIAECFPDREVIGISSVDLVLGQGTFHCLSQQEPN